MRRRQASSRVWTNLFIASPVRALVVACAATALLAACKPSSVQDAETKGDVAWLETNATPGAVEALGRLADAEPKALAVVKDHASKHDVGAYIAAWNAHLRGAAWGTSLLRAGLAETTGAELAAAAMTRKDPHLVDFIPDFEQAMVRMGSSSRATVISGALASIGEPAAAAVERRLLDGASRGSMCRGLASSEAGPDVRAVLFTVSPSARDDVACVSAVMALAATDVTAFGWLVNDGEPGMIRAASRPGGLTCEKMATLWAQVWKARREPSYASLTVPLSEILKRCPKEIDQSVASTLKTVPAAQASIIGAVDPYGGALAVMPATCTQLAMLSRGSLPPLVRSRADDAYTHGCLGSR